MHLPVLLHQIATCRCNVREDHTLHKRDSFPFDRAGRLLRPPSTSRASRTFRRDHPSSLSLFCPPSYHLISNRLLPPFLIFAIAALVSRRGIE